MVVTASERKRKDATLGRRRARPVHACASATGGQTWESVAVFSSILDAIGHTPLVRLSRVGRGLPVELYGKVEACNPGGSAKDRLALHLCDMAEKRGLLRPGGTIVEASAGNTGVGLAMVAAVRGYRCDRGRAARDLARQAGGGARARRRDPRVHARRGLRRRGRGDGARAARLSPRSVPQSRTTPSRTG